MMDRSSLIRKALEEAFKPAWLELIDDSASHAGHAGAVQSGGGHFYATIVSDVFEGKNPVQRHQLVYRALGDLMRTEVHAISIKALSTTEHHQKETLE